MILFVGPPGSGKSVQGQLLAARHDWRWLSAGQLLRDTKNKDVLEQMQSTDYLVDNSIVNKVIAGALHHAKSIEHIVLDGYPRTLDQAKWLIKELPKHERSINVVIVFEISAAEIMRRLRLRGRADDSPEVVSKRMADYQNLAEPILEYFRSLDIAVETVDGIGTVGTVHDRVEEVVNKCLLV
jgi:adenylate kinase